MSLDHYVRKTFYKTASLMANSAKAVAILGGQSREVSELAWQYGRHLGLAFQVGCLFRCFALFWFNIVRAGLAPWAPPGPCIPEGLSVSSLGQCNNQLPLPRNRPVKVGHGLLVV